MENFLGPDFLLRNDVGRNLYENYAKDMPIIDFHCHLNPQQIYENKRFQDLTEIWLGGDHYKWRLMRANGVDEDLITGDAEPYDKFLAWAKTMPMTIGNPLYHWSHLELKRYFGIDTLLDEATAPGIWNKANRLLQGEGFGARDFILKSNVEVVCTTDDPTDTLAYHQKIQADESFPAKVVPAFRPDKALEITRETFLPWVRQLGEVLGHEIRDYDDLLGGLTARAKFFHEVGCRVSDHALDTVPYASATLEDVSKVFAKALRGASISPLEEEQYKTYTLIFLGKLYARLGWVMQYHMNAYRNNNTRGFARLGPDTGYDAINDKSLAVPLQKLLDALAQGDDLPRTILYSLNPADFIVLATLMGSFQGDGIPGKLQLGAAWWFNDTKVGMQEQMRILAETGLLSRFVGMLTDSRSFMSYTRHDYFRRLLCGTIGQWVEQGEAPDDSNLLGNLVRGISYQNAREYFRFS